jgi:hypothetical protein
MSLSSWLVAGIVPGVERQPLKKLAVDESALLKLLHRWREEAEKAGRRIERIAVAFKAGRDGFWSGAGSSARHRGLRLHASSAAVSRQHRRAKTDRLDTELLKTLLSWLAATPGNRIGSCQANFVGDTTIQPNNDILDYRYSWARRQTPRLNRLDCTADPIERSDRLERNLSSWATSADRKCGCTSANARLPGSSDCHR